MSELTTEFLMVTARRPPSVMSRGHGSFLFDTEGRRYLDLVQGWAVNCLGHCPKVVVDAIAAQASELINCGPGYFNARAAETAALIARHSFGNRIFFASRPSTARGRCVVADFCLRSR